MSSNHRVLGNQGETYAIRYLSQHHYEIAETNWHCQFGEIDIIAKQKDIWVFVEVKTRRGSNLEKAFAAIQDRKKTRLLRSVHLYLSEHQLEEEQWRIDAIAIAIPGSGQFLIDHVEDALGW